MERQIQDYTKSIAEAGLKTREEQGRKEFAGWFTQTYKVIHSPLWMNLISMEIDRHNEVSERKRVDGRGCL
jgi:hypothetical protein